MAETAKANGLNPLSDVSFENRLGAEMSDEELAFLASWSTEVIDFCK